MIRILWTRPTQDNDRFKAALPKEITYLTCPCYHIQHLPTPRPQLTIDCVVVLSPHAVTPKLGHYQAPCFAIGPSTQQALAQYGIEADIPTQADSVHLLQLLSYQKSQHILIACGEHTRPWLTQQLIAQGIQVTQWIRYRRVPNPDLSDQLPSNPQTITHILATCVTTLHVLANTLPHLDYPLLCLSKRIEKEAKSLGFTHCFLAPTPSPEGLKQALLATTK